MTTAATVVIQIKIRKVDIQYENYKANFRKFQGLESSGD